MIAVTNNSIQITSHLLEHGADMSMTNNDGNFPLKNALSRS
jgi:hypothetical protein